MTDCRSGRLNRARYIFGADSTPGRLNIRLVALSVFFVLVAVACDASNQTGPRTDPASTPILPLDSSTATIDQILERTRAAMGAVTSYKTRGTMLVEGMDEDDGGSGELFTAWQAPDRIMFRTESLDPDSGEPVMMEIRSIGARTFARNPGEDWQELQPRPERESLPPDHLRVLGLDSIDLISADEITGDGTRVFRVLATEAIERSPESRTTFQTTLFIDSETYLFVTRMSDELFEFTAHGTTNGVKTEVSSWAHSVYTSHYYDYNEPVSIEVPNEYTPPREMVLPASTPTSTPVPDTASSSPDKVNR